MKRTVVLGGMLAMFALSAAAQTNSSISVQGQLKTCDESLLHGAVPLGSVNYSVPFDIKQTVSVGQPVVALSNDVLEAQVVKMIRTQSDHPGLFSRIFRTAILPGTHCNVVPLVANGEQMMRLTCRSPGDEGRNTYFMDAAGQFCNVAYRTDPIVGKFRKDLPGIAETPGAIAMYRSSTRTVIVFTDGKDGRLRFEVRGVQPDGTIGRSTSYEFDASSVIHGDPITVGPLRLRILEASATELSYQLVQ